MKNLGERCVSMFRLLAYCMTKLESVTYAMALLCYVIVLLRRDKLELPGFDETSHVRENHSILAWSCWAEEMKQVFEQTSSKLHIDSTEEMKKTGVKRDELQ